LDLALSKTPNARLLVIDPIAACLGKVDSHKNADVRGALAPLAALAARRGVAVVCIHHLNKSATGPAMYRAAGSLAFAAAARAVWLVAADRQDKRRRLLLPIKSNLAEALTGLAYCIEGDAARAVGRVIWDPRPIAIDADDALAILSADDAHDRTQVEEAKEWLLEVMKGEPIGWEELLRAAGKEHKEGTLRKARAELQKGEQIAKEKHGGGRGSKWLWYLTAHPLPLFAGLDESDAADDTAPELVGLASHKKPR
jgi:RecA-family ATPase